MTVLKYIWSNFIELNFKNSTGLVSLTISFMLWKSKLSLQVSMDANF